MLHPKRTLKLHFRRRMLFFCTTLLLSTLYLLDTYQLFFAQSDPGGTIPTEQSHTVFLPVVQLPLPPPTPTPTAIPTQEPPVVRDLEWDPRLDERGARLVRATVTPGQGYWRLVKAVWYNHIEAGGRHHILIDTLDTAANRQSAVAVQIAWPDGHATVQTEAKPGEQYATNYPMYALAPAYTVFPANGAPADRVEGLGLGEINEPYLAFHTSYGLVWRWTIASSAPTATTSPTPTVTIPSVTTTPTSTLSATPTAALTGTPTPATTPNLTPTATPSPLPPTTATPTATPTAAAHRFVAEVASCTADERGSRFDGYVYQAGQPANGQRIVFSYEANGPWVTQPTETGRGVPGFYAHIISAGVARTGDWFAWVIDNNGMRISTLAAFHTDGPGGQCNVFTINFHAN